jgi:hypothetical protein
VSKEASPNGESWRVVDQVIDDACKEMDAAIEAVGPCPAPPIRPRPPLALRSPEPLVEAVSKPPSKWGEALRRRLGMG